MDRFIVRKSPATFSSKKPPAASDSPAQLRLLSNNVGGARPRTPTLASSTAGHPNAAAASTTPHSPSARDLELMRIFQKDARRTPPLATLNSNAMAGVRTNANAFGGSGGAVGWSASASTEEVVNVDNRKVPVRMSTLEQENRSIGAGHSNALLKVNFPEQQSKAQTSATVSTKITAITSAAAKMRALQTNRIFDVSSTEQDIRTDEERAVAQLPPPTIQDVMRNVCVYVEVRSGADNRSQGIKSVIAELGAAVNDRLLRNTTHVIFKDGLLSTYQKAKAWNIPIVSILWIEACRRQVCLLDPARFTISDVDRYEQPELYDKMRKQRSMQPYAEETRRRVLKPSTAVAAAASNKSAAAVAVLATKANTSSSTSSSSTLNSNSDESASSARISVPRKPRDNLPSIFGDFVKTLQLNGVDNCLNKNSKLMDIIRNSPMLGAKTDTPSSNASTTNATAPPTTSSSKTRRTLFRSVSTETGASPKMLDDVAAAADPNLPSLRRSTRRSSMQNLSTMSFDQEPPAAVAPPPLAATPFNAKRRRTVFAAVVEENDNDVRAAASGSGSDMEISSDVTATPTPTPQSSAAIPLRQSVLKRRTMYTPQSINETRCPATAVALDKSGSATPAAPLSGSVRRRTMFTLSQGDPNAAERLDRLMSDGAASSSPAASSNSLRIDETIYSTPIASSTVVATAAAASVDSPSGGDRTIVTCDTPDTPIFGVAASTIMAEYTRSIAETTTAFSSDRPPSQSKRRTIFDMSMEIIGQRLQNINRIASSARKNRSMSESDAPPEAIECSAPIGIGSDGTESCDGDMMKIRRRTTRFEPIVEATMDLTAMASTTTTATTATKKRKLFNPSAMSCSGDYIDAIEPQTVGTMLPQSTTTATTVVKPTKRKLYAPTSPSHYGEVPTECDPIKRRRDDSTYTNTVHKQPEIQRPVSAAAAKPKAAVAALIASIKMPTTSQRLSASSQRRRTTMDFASSKSTTSTVSAAVRSTGVAKQQPKIVGYLVSTNMHHEQIANIKETVAKLGAFKLEPSVSGKSTHLVSLEPLRTVNILRGLIRGLWILRYDWIVESAAAGRWLPEEPFEVADFSAAVSLSRLARQSIGASYRMGIFVETAPMYITPNCACPNLRELVLLCDGRIVDQADGASYVISDVALPMQPKSTTDLANGVVVRSTWILDSISIGKVKKWQSYALATGETSEQRQVY